MMLYKIRSKTNKSAYYGMIYGIENNDYKAILESIKSGADPSLLELAWPLLKIERPIYLKAVPFMEKHCSPDVLERVMGERLTENQKLLIIVKKIHRNDKTVTLSIQKYLNKDSVNKLRSDLDIKENVLNNQDQPVTLLHLAASLLNFTAVKALLDVGADPNLGVRLARTGSPKRFIETPIRFASLGRNGLFPVEGSYGKTVITLLQSGAKMSRMDWELILRLMDAKDLDQVLKIKIPRDLEIYEQVQNTRHKSLSLLHGNTEAFLFQPMIRDVLKIEGRKIVLDDLSALNASKFFSNRSIKDALQERFGTSSPRLSKIVTEQIFGTLKTVSKISTEILKKGDFLKKIFLDRPNPNMSDFIEMMETEASVSLLDFELRQRNFISDSQFGVRLFGNLQVHPGFGFSEEYDDMTAKDDLKFLSIFTDQQLKSLLTPSKEDDNFNLSGDLIDMLRMYKRNYPKTKELLKSVPFTEISSFTKIHDLLAIQSKKFDQKNYKLNQEKKHPNLKEITSISLPDGFSITVAKTSHELIDWGDMLGHCIGGGDYAEQAKRGESILLGLMKDEVVTYTVEIRSGEIMQAQGKSRTSPPENVLKELRDGLKKINLLIKKKNIKSLELHLRGEADINDFDFFYPED